SNKNIFACPFLEATKRNSIEATKYMFSIGCKVEWATQRPGHHKSALQSAIEAGSFETVLFLLDNGAQTDGADLWGWTCLHSAAFKGHLGCVVALLKTNLDKMAKDKQGWTALDLAHFYKFEDIVALL